MEIDPHYANRGHEKVAELLLANKAEVDPKAKGSYTPLYFAAFGGFEDLTVLLLANNADVNALDGRGGTLLHLVAFRGHKNLMDLLREHGGHE